MHQSPADEERRPGGRIPYAASQRAKRFRPTGLPKTPRRVMSAARRAYFTVLVLLIRAVLRLVWSTCRVVPVTGVAHLERLRTDNSPAIIAYWHQMQIFCAWCLLKHAKRGLPLKFLTSPSISGEVPAAIIRQWGVGALRGSARRSAGQTLRAMYEVLVGEKTSLVVTPDGPTGPYHEFKAGTIMLARMAKVPIVLVAYAASPCTRWDSWDRFIVPWPFARVAIAVDEPFLVPAGKGVDDLPRIRQELEVRMAALIARAEASVRR